MEQMLLETISKYIKGKKESNWEQSAWIYELDSMPGQSGTLHNEMTSLEKKGRDLMIL